MLSQPDVPGILNLISFVHLEFVGAFHGPNIRPLLLPVDRTGS